LVSRSRSRSRATFMPAFYTAALNPASILRRSGLWP